MIRFKRTQIVLWYAILFVCCECPFTAHSLVQQTKQWTNLNFNGGFLDSQNIKYLLEIESRYNLEFHKLDEGIIRSGLGYQYASEIVFWFAYEWNSHNQVSGRDHVDRLWQQIVWRMVHQENISIISRSRLEERTQQNEPQWNDRFRQRIRLEFAKLKNITPILSEEVFFNITKPPWVANKTFEQNRFFVGIDILTSPSCIVELGYLNQYQFRTSQNQMNNILLLSFIINT